MYEDTTYTVRKQQSSSRCWGLPVTYKRAALQFLCTPPGVRQCKAKDREVSSVRFKPVLHQCVRSSRTAWQPYKLGAGPVSKCSVVGSVVWKPVQVRAEFASMNMNLGNKASVRAHLAGFGIHVPTAEEFFHNPHVLLCFHSGEGCQHDWGIARLVLVVHVTHVCKDTSLFRETPSPNMN